MAGKGEIKFDLARAYLEMGDVAEARKLLEEAIADGYKEAASLLATLGQAPAKKSS